MGRRLHYRPGSFYRTDDRPSGSHDVLPCAPRKDHADRTLRDPEPLRERGLRTAVGLYSHQYRQDDAFIKDGHSILGAKRRSVSMTAFGHFVGGVDEIIAKKEMIGVPARRIVAAVKHVHSVWNCPVVLPPGNAMHKFTGGTVVNAAIAALHTVAPPNPTLGDGVDGGPSPEARQNICWGICHNRWSLCGG